MKNHNDEAMHAYFNALLSESEVKPTQEDIVEENLSVNNSIFNRDLSFAPKIITDVRTEPSINKDDNWQNLQVECEFQVLFFKFSGLHFAVPLIDISGIHALDNPLNQLLGKPNWFYGVMTHQDKLYNLVDSAQWMNMEKSGKTLNYSHYIILGNSGWGLCCERLLGTETLQKSEIKWRNRKGNSPWLAGMVKDKMCVLLHVDELVKLLNNGLNLYGK